MEEIDKPDSDTGSKASNIGTFLKTHLSLSLIHLLSCGIALKRSGISLGLLLQRVKSR